MTGRPIARSFAKLMRNEGLTDEEIDAQMETLLEAIRHRARMQSCRRESEPSVFLRELCELFDGLEQERNVVLGLLTGNIEHGRAGEAWCRRNRFHPVQGERLRVGS